MRLKLICICNQFFCWYWMFNGKYINHNDYFILGEEKSSWEKNIFYLHISVGFNNGRLSIFFWTSIFSVIQMTIGLKDKRAPRKETNVSVNEFLKIISQEYLGFYFFLEMFAYKSWWIKMFTYMLWILLFPVYKLLLKQRQL